MVHRDQRKKSNLLSPPASVTAMDCIYCGFPTSVITGGICIDCRKVYTIAVKRPAVIGLILATALQTREKEKEKFKRSGSS